jgi:hypothetical protein
MTLPRMLRGSVDSDSKPTMPRRTAEHRRGLFFQAISTRARSSGASFVTGGWAVL